MKNSKEKTLREVYEGKMKTTKIKKWIILGTLGTFLIGCVTFSILNKEEIYAKYQEIRASIGGNGISESDSSEPKKEEVGIISNEKEGSSLFQNENEETISYTEDDTSQENYTSDSKIIYQKDNSTGTKYTPEEVAAALAKLTEESSYPEYVAPSYVAPVVPYSPTPFDMGACVSKCNYLATEYYNSCTSAYDKYVKSANDAYNNSLSNCIASLGGRNDPICKTNAQKLYDQYMNSSVGKMNYAYCAQQRTIAYNSSYETLCASHE